MREFIIHTLCTQAGKTSLFLDKMKYYIDEKINIIILSPNKTSIQQQTHQRILKKYGFSPKRADSRTNVMDKFDIYSTTNNVDCIMCLNNKFNLSKICAYIIRDINKNKKFHIIIDEIHSVFPKNLDDYFVSQIMQMINEKQEITYEYLKKKEHSHNKIMYLLLMLYIRNPNTITMFGVTATTFSIINSPIVSKFKENDIMIYTDRGRLSDCYIGYEKSEKKIFGLHSNMTFFQSAIYNILQENREFIVMCHVGKLKSHHYDAGEKFSNICNDIDYCCIIHNGDGYTISGSRHTEHTILGKNVKIPSDIIVKCVNEYGYKRIGIFGDICMNMGNTYNDPGMSVFLTDMVVLNVDTVEPNSDKASELIQKIGRSSFNDVNYTKPSVTIWFSTEEQKNRFDLFYRAECMCQLECQTTPFSDISPNEIIKKVL